MAQMFRLTFQWRCGLSRLDILNRNLSGKWFCCHTILKREMTSGSRVYTATKMNVGTNANSKATGSVISNADVSKFVYLLATMKKDISPFLVKLATMISNAMELWKDPDTISSAIFLLRHYNSDQNGVLQVLRAATNKAALLASGFSSLQLTKCVVGLRNMSDQRPEVRKCISVLSSSLSTQSSPLQNAEIGLILSSLGNMSCEHIELKTFIAAITVKIDERDEETCMDSSSIGRSLSGLKGMSDKVFLFNMFRCELK